MNESQSTAEVPTPHHHIAINNSINSISSIVRQLNALKDRLTGEPNKPCGADVAKSSEPSFIDVLNHTPDNIHAECNEAGRIIQEIQEMLF